MYLKLLAASTVLSLVPLTSAASPRTEPAPCTATVCVGVENSARSDDQVRVYRGENCTQYRIDLVPNSDTYDVSWGSFRLIEGTEIARVTWTDIDGRTGTYRFKRTKTNKGCKRTLQRIRLTYTIKTWDKDE